MRKTIRGLGLIGSKWPLAYVEISFHGAGGPTDAVGMLSAELVPDAAAKREWTRHFSAIKSIHVIAIEPSAVATMAPCYEYKVKLEAHIFADSEAAMPFYGWEDNPNFRWIRLCPDERDRWAISSFGTGP